MSSAYIADALTEIYDRHGRIDPGLVVEESRPAGHPLHHRIWRETNEEAAHNRRLDLAQRLIREVTIVRVAEDGREATRVRAFIHIPKDEGDEEGLQASYVPAEVVAASSVLTEIARREMQRRIRDLRRAYGEFEEFWKELRGLLESAA
jgi:hypothetical protein